ncbi:1256_t:CDS:2, partial [Acaulospora colombiana]
KLYPHHLTEDPNIQELVGEEVLLSHGFYQELAVDFLVDEDGRPLVDLPFELDPTIISEELIWRDDKTPAHPSRRTTIYSSPDVSPVAPAQEPIRAD